jgi:hypothetical protein
MRWSEWQIDLDIAYKIDLLVPYIGVKYAKQFAKVVTASLPISNSGLKFLSMQSRQPLGMVVGCTLTTGKYFMLNVEGRLIDEQAVTISGDIRF